MLVSELVGKNKNEITSKELRYMLREKITKVYYYSNENDFFTFYFYEDGSITKHDAKDDIEYPSNVEEMEELKKKGYKIEDATDEYAVWN
jgi:hypothetical protein